jgi:hypothetical protein
VPTQSEAQLVSNLNAAVVHKAIQEPAFRAQLLADPKSAVEKALNAPLPAGLTLKVIEAGKTDFTVVLPYEPKTSANGEMSDDDLESVAGGSKAGANSFFNSLANGLTGTGGSDGSAEGAAGAILGSFGAMGGSALKVASGLL